MTPGISVLCAAVAAFGMTFAAGRNPPPEKQPKPVETAKGVAVVELFTSEGCSSCPPADRVFSEIHERAIKDGSHVYMLAFHVDYWNYLGWRDPFSTAEFSERQRDYAAALKTSSVYTPQLIVNGVAGFVGSERARADREVEQALAKAASVTVTISLADRKPGEPMVVEVISPGVPKGSQVCVALTEDGLSTDVKSGENEGQHLKHDGVVRAFAAAAPDSKDKASLTLTPPKGVDENKASIVAFVQDKATKRVLGAAGMPLNKKIEPAKP